MAIGYKFIASSTVGSGGASTVTFSSIAATYTDLLVKMSTRRDSGANDGIGIRFNGSSAGNYSMKNVSGDGSSAASSSAAAVSIVMAQMTGLLRLLVHFQMLSFIFLTTHLLMLNLHP